MVSIIPSERSGLDIISKQIGSQISQNFPQGFQQGLNRGQLQNSLDEIKLMSQNPETKPLDIMLAAMKAGAGIPGSERYLGAIIPELMKVAEANKSIKTPLAGERDRTPIEMPQQRPEVPPFANIKQNQPNQNFPTNIGPQGQTGNLPQEATTGVKIPIPSPRDMIQEGRKLAEESTKNGVPMTAREGYEQVKNFYDDSRLHNKEVDAEREQRQKAQRDYGPKAVQALTSQYPKATPEMQAIFKKKIEEKAAQGESEADIERYIAKESENWANKISGISSDLSAPRLQNILLKAAEGSYKNFDESAKDLRVKLEPLLKEGLYDTSRELLQDLGYYPEEREMIINPLSEREKTTLNKVPKYIPISNQHGISLELLQNPGSENLDINNVKDGLTDLKKSNPNFSLLLARKFFEDKGYDWRIFKNALNDMIDKKEINLEDDQQNQLNYLDNAPLSTLGKFLQGINIQGR